jgi:16S rRNA (cytosine967-C5)-methyltransferase
MLMPGGVLVYAVCSLQQEECALVIEKFLAQTSQIKRWPISASELGSLGEVVTPSGDLRTLPCHLSHTGGMDGFYACRLRHV